MPFIDTFGPDQCRNLWVVKFLGTPAVQFWSDFLVWERFLDEHPEAKGILELGTGAGGFSLYLLMQCLQRDMKFDTFDTFRPEVADTRLGRMLGLGGCCHVANLWNEGGDQLRSILADPNVQHPLILFCDDGDKPREFRLFVPYLKPGDLVAVHDWCNEFSPENITPEVLPLVEETFVAESEQVGSLTRFYRRI